jgi:RNA polymerase sigma factor (sigma-70 family)
MKDMLNLVEPLIPALRRYARSMVRNRAVADDLVQDTLERAIARWHQRKIDGDARAWLFTILHNLAISQMRQTKRRGFHDDIDDADEGVMATRATQEDSLAYGDLMKAVQRLPEDQRSVLLLISVEDLSYAETAAVLSIPLGTVMSRLSRAREKLLALMETGAVAVPSHPFLRRVK